MHLFKHASNMYTLLRECDMPNIYLILKLYALNMSLYIQHNSLRLSLIWIGPLHSLVSVLIVAEL